MLKTDAVHEVEREPHRAVLLLRHTSASPWLTTPYRLQTRARPRIFRLAVWEGGAKG